MNQVVDTNYRKVKFRESGSVSNATQETAAEITPANEPTTPSDLSSQPKNDVSFLEGSAVKKYLSKGKPLNSVAQCIVLNNLRYFQQQKAKGLFAGNEISETALAAGISTKMVYLILERARNNQQLTTPGKYRPRQKFVKIDTLPGEFELPIWKENSPSDHEGKWFVYRKRDSRLVFLERSDIRQWRADFERRYLEVLREGHPIFYGDETWVNEGYQTSKVWEDSLVRKNPEMVKVGTGLTYGYKNATGKGKRFIILAYDSKDVWVTGPDGKRVELIFQSKHTRDYHEDMDGEKFLKPFREELLPNLPKDSVVIIDNTSYHSELIEAPPTSSSTRTVMTDWLEKHGIAYEKQTKTKIQLYRQFIQPIRSLPQYKKYKVDELARSVGVEVLRLPPYHCQFNPIELAWAKVKFAIAKRWYG